VYDNLYVMSAAGGPSQSLGHAALPCWSTDSSHIIAIDGPADGGGGSLIRYTLHSGRLIDRTLIVRKTRNDVRGGAFSPDGTSIAILGRGIPGHTDKPVLYLTDELGKYPRLLADESQTHLSYEVTCLSW